MSESQNASNNFSKFKDNDFSSMKLSSDSLVNDEHANKSNELPTTQTDAKAAKFKLLEKQLREATIDQTAPLIKPTYCLFFNDSPICSLGEFSMIIGKAKSKKTFLSTMMASVMLGGDNPVINANLPSDKSVVLYFDTEQGVLYAQKVSKRLLRLIGKEQTDRLQFVHLRNYNPKNRMEIIEHSIENTPNLAFVIIDGVKDLVVSINNEEESNNVATKLLKWTEEKNIHILTVLHQNKSDNNARGHIGTELINKAETVLSVEKQGDGIASTVESVYNRGEDPGMMAFQIEDDLPVILEDYTKPEKARGRAKFDPMKLDVSRIIKRCFGFKTEMKRTELLNQIQNAYRFFEDDSIGESNAKKILTQASNSEFIIQEKERAPYTMGKVLQLGFN